MDDKSTTQRLLDFFEHPFVWGPIGIVGGLVGLFFYTPILFVCGACLLLAFHRTKVVSDKSTRTKVIAYGVLLAVTSSGLYGIKMLIQAHAPDLGKDIADQVVRRLSDVSRPTPTPSPIPVPRQLAMQAPSSTPPSQPGLAIRYLNSGLNGRVVVLTRSVDPHSQVQPRMFIDPNYPSDFALSGISMHNVGNTAIAINSAYIDFADEITEPQSRASQYWQRAVTSESNYKTEFRYLYQMHID